MFSRFCVVFSVFLACLLPLPFLAFLSHSFVFATSSTMEDDYRVVDWPEFEPKNKTWKGALEINELKGESTIEFMLWRKETLIQLSTQNLVHHPFLNKVPTGEPVLIKFEEEMEEVTEKMEEAEKIEFWQKERSWRWDTKRNWSTSSKSTKDVLMIVWTIKWILQTYWIRLVLVEQRGILVIWREEHQNLFGTHWS